MLAEQRLREESEKQNKQLEQQIQIYAGEIEASKKGQSPWQQQYLKTTSKEILKPKRRFGKKSGNSGGIGEEVGGVAEEQHRIGGVEEEGRRSQEVGRGSRKRRKGRERVEGLRIVLQVRVVKAIRLTCLSSTPFRSLKLPGLRRSWKRRWRKPDRGNLKRKLFKRNWSRQRSSFRRDYLSKLKVRSNLIEFVLVFEPLIAA